MRSDDPDPRQKVYWPKYLASIRERLDRGEETFPAADVRMLLQAIGSLNIDRVDGPPEWGGGGEVYGEWHEVWKPDAKR